MVTPSSKRQDVLSNVKLPLPLLELVVMVASMMALNAFAIDIMLPALGDIADTYQLKHANDQQLIVFSYILGFGLPQLVFGPVSDAFGRRNLLRICLIGYAIAGFACMYTTTFELLLVVRFLQGVVASGIRVVAVSIVRDLVAGRAMARVMSLVMTIFMIVPIIAPAVGTLVIALSSWHWSFGVLGVASLALLVWVQLRLPETLAMEKRSPLSLKNIVGSFGDVLGNRVTLGYMAASGVIFGALFAFISSSEQIFSDVFDEGDRFALWFAVIAGVLAVGNLTNSRLVERFGMRRISHGVIFGFILLSLTNAIALHIFGEKLYIFVPLFALTFGCFGMMGANFSAIAMEPQGKNAGTASAIYGFATTTVASFFGWAVASNFNGHVTPVLFGFVALGVLALMIVLITERGKLFELGH